MLFLLPLPENIKYSIKDSQDSFIVFGESVDVMQQHLEQLKSYEDPIQLFILIVGTIFYPKEILVIDYIFW